MQQIYNCPNCGAPVEYNQQFCRNCGITLSWPSPQYPQNNYPEQQYYQNQQQWQQPPPQEQWNQQGYSYQQDTYNQQTQWQNQYNGQYQTREPHRRSKGFPLSLLIAITVLFVVIGGGALMFFNGAFDDLLAGNSSGPSSSDAVVANYQESPSITVFNADPSYIEQGGTSYLTWQVENATSVVIDQGIGSTGSQGSQAVQPSITTTYTITASNSGGSVSASTQVIVNEVAVPEISSFTASSTSIDSGDSTTLSWSVTGADTISINQDIGTVSESGSESVSPTETITYTLTATNSAGSSTATVTITVEEDAPVITVFTTSSDNITYGDYATLEWYVTGADTISIDQDIGTVSSYGSEAVYPDETTTYTITASNDGGSTTAELTVYVDPLISYFSASSTSITSGDSITLSWYVISADTVYIDQSIGIVDEQDSTTVTPSATTTYTLYASNDYLTVSQSITITVSSE